MTVMVKVMVMEKVNKTMDWTIEADNKQREYELRRILCQHWLSLAAAASSVIGSVDAAIWPWPLTVKKRFWFWTIIGHNQLDPSDPHSVTHIEPRT